MTEGAVGRLSRIDPKTGEITTFAQRAAAVDRWHRWCNRCRIHRQYCLRFGHLGRTRCGRQLRSGHLPRGWPTDFALLADIGAFSSSYPPSTSFLVPTGVQYALETYRGGFLVTDGHHNRVLNVTLKGEITEFYRVYDIREYCSLGGS